MANTQVLVAQIGARRHYAVPRALHSVGMLARLHTDAAGSTLPWRWLQSVWPEKWQPGALRRLVSRKVDGVPADKVVGAFAFTLSGMRGRSGTESQTDYWCRRNKRFAEIVVSSGFDGIDAVYGFNAAAVELFSAARKQGLARVLDQTAAPWRWNLQMLQSETRRWPDWEARTEQDTNARMAEREELEWKLADRIVCGSEFCREATIATGAEPGKCVVIPYPTDHIKVIERRDAAGTGCNVLYVGTLNLRKGLPYLLEAATRLSANSLVWRLVGPSELSESAMQQLSRHCEITGAVPRPQVADHLRWADMLILPTLSEGSANVCYEAMRAGVPVITTPNAGATIVDGENGLLVAPGDSDGLAAAVEKLAASAKLRAQFARVAQEKLALHTMESYARQMQGMMAGVSRK